VPGRATSPRASGQVAAAWQHEAVGSRGVDLDDVAVFVQVVEAGGFTAAARVLQVPKSSVSRKVARLEARLGTRLLQRTTRSVVLTEAGRAFHHRVAAALGEVREAASAAFDTHEVPRGAVRVVAPPDVGGEVLPRLVAAFLRRYPEVSVDVELSPGRPDLVEHGYDLALRVGRESDPALASVKVQDIAFALYAGPGYLARAGTPESVEELAGHQCVLFRPQRGRCTWRLDGPAGRVDVVVRGHLSANDLAFVRRAVLADSGIGLLPELVGRVAVERGALVEVLPGHRAGGQPLYLVHPASAHVPLRVRALRDHLLAHFPR
jgi:DNA-binding transcriptional LysR family regulator